jgi:hypothetical protein
VIQAADIADVRRLAEGLYAELRDKLFGLGHPSKPATLTIEIADEKTPSVGTGYIPSENRINLQVAERDLEEDDVLDIKRWPVWKVDLVEELAHEYQHKVQPPVTATARTLKSRHELFFGGKQHDEVFFSAVEVLAPLLGLEPDKLARILKGEML